MLALTAVVLGTALIHQPAAAGDLTMRESVSYADLDLGTTAGQTALMARTNAASLRVCVDTHDNDARSLCIREARADAALQVAKIMKAWQAGR